MTIDKIRGHIDALGLPSRLDKDRDLIVNIRPDGEFAYQIVVCMMLENGNRLSFVAGAPDYTPGGDLLAVANRHNSTRHIPTAVVRDGRIRFEYAYLLDDEVSENYLRYDCIMHTLICIREGFMNIETEGKP